MEQQTIRIKYHSNEIEKLTYIDGKSDWIDLRSAEHVVLKKGEFKLIKLGVSMQLPAGYEAVIVPRSSTYKNFGIIQTNHMGVVDESYCGDDDIWKRPPYHKENRLPHYFLWPFRILGLTLFCFLYDKALHLSQFQLPQKDVCIKYPDKMYALSHAP